MDLVTGIILSSGNVVKIPIFPTFDEKSLPNSYTIATRAGGVIHEYQGNAERYSLLSHNDLLELANICFGRNKTQLDMHTPITEGHHVSMLAWVDTMGLGIRLQVPFTSSGADSFRLAYKTLGTSRGDFYDGIAVSGEHVYDFYDDALAVNRSTTPLYNVRPGGVYSIDIGYKAQPATITLDGTGFTMSELVANFEAYKELNPDADVSFIIYDPDSNTDPYIVDEPSTIGGGDGDKTQDIDSVEKATIPPLPSLSAVSTGMITLYNCTEAQLNALGTYLWSDIFDVDTNFKKLFADPMDCIIGLGIVPVHPSISGGANVKFGNIDTSVSMSKISSQYVELDCGTIKLSEYIGSFLDYAPYVNISIYLPYIGFRELSPDDVMNDTIHVVYHVDVLTGGCCAMIETGKKGLLYSFNGSCITNVPLTAINFSGAIQNAVSAIGAGVTTVAGIATGAAPLTAMGATQLLTSGANTALNSKPSISRSGSMGGSAGLMSYQKPYIIINRPRMSVPDKLNKFVGNTLNVTMNLGNLKGFTQVELIHLDGIPCTDNERNELETLLKGGVIF